MNSSKIVYKNNNARCIVGGFFGLCTAVFIAQGFDPGKGGVGLQVFAFFSALASASVTARALVAPSIVASPNGVLVRTVFRTRKYGWAEIERFQVRDGLVGRSPSLRRILGIVLSNGENVWFSELNARTKVSGWVDDAVLKLNSLVPG